MQAKRWTFCSVPGRWSTWQALLREAARLTRAEMHEAGSVATLAKPLALAHLGRLVATGNHERATTLIGCCPLAQRHLCVSSESVGLKDPGAFRREHDEAQLARIHEEQEELVVLASGLAAPKAVRTRAQNRLNKLVALATLWSPFRSLLAIAWHQDGV